MRPQHQSYVPWFLIPSPLAMQPNRIWETGSREISPEERELQLSFESAGQDVYFKTCYLPTTLLHNSLVFSVLIQHWDKGLMPSWPNPCKMCWCLRVVLDRDILQGPILGGVPCSKDYGICDVRRTAKRSLT